MTTLKEYKAMMEGATGAPWYVALPDEEISVLTIKSGEWVICEMACCIDNDVSGEQHANIITASRNIAPELIRVIELAEDAITRALSDGEAYIDKCNETLLEIRKLKGE